jgi:hypothetical protein
MRDHILHSGRLLFNYLCSHPGHPATS